jgi:DNA-binding GntR family transcriptional regulator
MNNALALKKNARIGDGHVSLQEKVKAELQASILSGRLKPGARLVESQLALQYGVSRNPIREAIRALESEGLVEVNARRGATVAIASDSEAREMIEVRALLEGQNARLAARRKDPAILRRLDELLKRGRAAAAADRLDQLPALNAQFHHELAVAAHNTFLAELLENVRLRTDVFFSPSEHALQVRLWEEHAAILQAIVDSDESRAAQLATEHVTNAV